MLFGRGQHSLQANDEQIADQVRMDVLGAAAHVFLFKAGDAVANRPLRFHLVSSWLPSLCLVTFSVQPRGLRLAGNHERGGVGFQTQ